MVGELNINTGTVWLVWTKFGDESSCEDCAQDLARLGYQDDYTGPLNPVAI